MNLQNFAKIKRELATLEVEKEALLMEESDKEQSKTRRDKGEKLQLKEKKIGPRESFGIGKRWL